MTSKKEQVYIEAFELLEWHSIDSTGVVIDKVKRHRKPKAASEVNPEVTLFQGEWYVVSDAKGITGAMEKTPFMAMCSYIAVRTVQQLDKVIDRYRAGL